ncbi:FAD-binding domain-containing protein [Marasmius fiardii PR-910]|nr:FAD-binding domain-containing protein [Marasmius fiardii PR-910]
MFPNIFKLSAKKALLLGCVLHVSSASASTGNVCSQLDRIVSHVYRQNDARYALDIAHFAVSAQQNASCTVEPQSAEEVSSILNIIGKNRTPFAIKGGGHNLNLNFSSTSGVLISMTRLNHLEYDKKTSTVEVGAGMIWDDVYAQLHDKNVSVVGARATGLGVGGFIVAGGGYSYKTNQYGLAVDNVVAIEIVLPNGQIKKISSKQDKELFFAVRGGGNNFGIVTKFTLKAHPQTDVWGGTIVYPSTVFSDVSSAVLNYTSRNVDPKTGLQCTFARVQGQGTIMVNLFYDAPSPAPGIFDAFLNITSVSSDIKTRPYLSMIQSANTDSTAGISDHSRGIYNTISHTDVTASLLSTMQNETEFYSAKLQTNGLLLNGYVIEPFLPEAYHRGDTDTAYPPNRNDNIHPMNIYYAWTNADSDQSFYETSRTTAASLQQFASKEGLLASAKYPNYAIFGTDVKELYGSNLKRLRDVKRRVDPKNIMGLTGGFKVL